MPRWLTAGSHLGRVTSEAPGTACWRWLKSLLARTDSFRAGELPGRQIKHCCGQLHERGWSEGDSRGGG